MPVLCNILHVSILCDSCSVSAPANDPAPVLQLEARRLSAVAIALHERALMLPADPSRPSPLLQLREPVLLGGAREARSVDPELLALPLPLVSAAAPEDEGAPQVFPSVLQMQADAEVADAARAYLLRLLQGLVGDGLSEEPAGPQRGAAAVRAQLVQRLRDPELLLFVSLLLGDDLRVGVDQNSPVRVLCEALLKEGDCLPAEALAVLEATRRALL